METRSLKRILFPNLVLFSNIICISQRLKILFNEFFNFYSITECANSTKLIGRWKKAVKMCINSTKDSFTVDKGFKCFIFIVSTWIKNILFCLSFSIVNDKKYWKASKCFGEVNKTALSSKTLVVMRVKGRWTTFQKFF